MDAQLARGELLSKAHGETFLCGPILLDQDLQSAMMEPVDELPRGTRGGRGPCPQGPRTKDSGTSPLPSWSSAFRRRPMPLICDTGQPIRRRQGLQSRIPTSWDVHEKLYGVSMVPSSCGATSPDSAVSHPQLTDMIWAIAIEVTQLMDFSTLKIINDG